MPPHLDKQSYLVEKEPKKRKKNHLIGPQVKVPNHTKTPNAWDISTL